MTCLRRARLVLLAAAGGLLVAAPPALADGGARPGGASSWAPLIITGILFVVLIGGVSLLQFRSTRRQYPKPERASESGPDAWEEDEP